jgi:hypothetical protein
LVFGTHASCGDNGFGRAKQAVFAGLHQRASRIVESSFP